MVDAKQDNNAPEKRNWADADDDDDVEENEEADQALTSLPSKENAEPEEEKKVIPKYTGTRVRNIHGDYVIDTIKVKEVEVVKSLPGQDEESSSEEEESEEEATPEPEEEVKKGKSYHIL
jgi:hypothetical protein